MYIYLKFLPWRLLLAIIFILSDDKTALLLEPIADYIFVRIKSLLKIESSFRGQDLGVITCSCAAHEKVIDILHSVKAVHKMISLTF